MTESDGPIVTAVREARARIAAECDYDLQHIVERLREVEKAHAARLRSPRQETTSHADTRQDG